MTQDEPVILTISGSSSSSFVIKASSTKLLKTPNQPNHTSLEKKLEVLTAMVLKATKSIATLELKLPTGPQTEGTTRTPKQPTQEVPATPTQNSTNLCCPQTSFCLVPRTEYFLFCFADACISIYPTLRTWISSIAESTTATPIRTASNLQPRVHTSNLPPSFYSQPPPPFGHNRHLQRQQVNLQHKPHKQHRPLKFK